MTRVKVEDIKYVCCQCNKFVKGNPKGKHVSHTYCEACYDKVMKELKEND